tara:strand:- start:3355 stop:4626 length:1272 start_codon:yes stop_codon:yes gene_type:complete
MRGFRPYIFLIISIALFWFSCKKENDTFPSISQIKVNQSGSYKFGDTIIVQVTIKDVDGPVRISILKGAQSRPLPTELFSKRGDDYSYRIFVNDKYYESNSYSIRIQAFNGENGRSKFQSIRIEGLEKAIRGICFIGKSGNQSILYKIDSIGQKSQILLPSESFKKLVSDSRNSQLLTLPQSTGNLKAFNYSNLLQDFSLNLNPNSLEFENLYHIDGLNYMILKDGRVFSVDASGNDFLEFSLEDNFLARKMAFDDEKMLVAAVQAGTTLNELFLLRRSNNSLVQRSFIGYEIVDLCYTENDIFYLIYLKNGECIISEYNANSGLVTEKYQLDAEIPQSLEYGLGMVYISTDKNIYTFPAHNFQFPQLIFSFGAEEMKFDELNNEIYIISGNNIWKAALASSQNQFFASSTEPFTGLDIVYNK